ncbi:tyrosinase family protein [Calothrix rhizosoleniae]|uniref:tyrosinase family protein n=1 Tax=Calothrix rhizosoleniae TaxID=888997 RepID=UPI00135662AE|nr:tyrosinase family protein [Calothrix rhizosoleniae]
MKALPSSDPRNWEQQARIHQRYCPHGNWYFLPWHRAYLLAFEEICRDLSGNPDFALPYWNWTVDTSIPEPFWSGTLRDATRRISSTDRIGAEFVGQNIIDDILDEEDFELFASLRPTGQNNTDQSWQMARGALAPLERTPPNNIHTWISGNMTTLRSPLDPIFWLHHCNIDRIWAEWNARGNRNTDNILWTDFSFRQNFIDINSRRYDVVVRDLVDVNQLGYSYDVLTQPQETPSLMERVLSRSAGIHRTTNSYFG